MNATELSKMKRKTQRRAQMGKTNTTTMVAYHRPDVHEYSGMSDKKKKKNRKVPVSTIIQFRRPNLISIQNGLDVNQITKK